MRALLHLQSNVGWGVLMSPLLIFAWHCSKINHVSWMQCIEKCADENILLSVIILQII